MKYIFTSGNKFVQKLKNKFKRKCKLKYIRKLKYISSANCPTFIYQITQLLNYIIHLLLPYFKADTFYRIQPGIYFQYTFVYFLRNKSTQSIQYFTPGGQVCIVPIYLTPIYESCQLIHLKWKKIYKDGKKAKSWNHKTFQQHKYFPGKSNLAKNYLVKVT